MTSAHKTAGALISERRFRDAIAPAAEACRQQPESADAWSNYAVALKHGHQWVECLAACERVLALDPEPNAGALWNAGIAATALGNWVRARGIWSKIGVSVPPGTGPLEMSIGFAGVRVSPEQHPEVIFAKRLDPCRARIISVPLPESGRRFGDIVLHDGEPRGKRRIGNGTCSVFDELLLLEPSRCGTWRVEATCHSPAERDAILASFDDVEGAIEDWTESIEMLCAQCSLGEPHDHDGRVQPWAAERSFGLALFDERELARLPVVQSTARVL